MLSIQQIKLPVSHTKEQLEQKLLSVLKISKNELISWKIKKQSLDARKKPKLFFVYNLTAHVAHEREVLKKVDHKMVMLTSEKPFTYLFAGDERKGPRPVVVGSGPAGLFCAYYLAKAGMQPLILERGDDVDTRLKKVNEFWNGSSLDTESNVQFGEGGAGTFSDGKLNTLVKDPFGRNKEVLRLFVECGAPEEILYVQKPHLGTDALISIVKNLRQKIQAMGGEFRFRTALTGIVQKNGVLKSIECNHNDTLDVSCLVLATGHSARDTFSMLYDSGLSMEAKSFAIGLRMEHPQSLINQYQYGMEQAGTLGAASYKLTHKARNGRGVYSFCMCPGGYVVNASSEENRLAVNGMSYQDRTSSNANSALIVTVTPKDFPSAHPLAGTKFQSRLERCAYRLGNGQIPIQLFGDYVKNQTSNRLGDVSPCMKGAYQFANLRELFQEEINLALVESIRYFERIIPGFSRYDAVLSGVESRTSSPVKLLRDETYESNIRGIYPCGEGAGYAGGITSAAIDGLKTGEAIMKNMINFC